MFYGLSKLHDELAEHVNRYIALAPCSMVRGSTYEGYQYYYPALIEAGFNSIGGSDFSSRFIEKCGPYENYAPAGHSDESTEEEKDTADEEDTAADDVVDEDEDARRLQDENDDVEADGDGDDDEDVVEYPGYCAGISWIDDSYPEFPLASEIYFMANGIEERFQERIPLDKYVSGEERQSDLIDLSVIDIIPVTLVVGTEDTSCTPEDARDIFDSIGDTNKVLRYEQDFTHIDFYVGAASPTFIDRLVETIETGSVEDDKDQVIVAPEETEEEEDEEVIDADADWGECDSATTILSGSIALAALAISLQ